MANSDEGRNEHNKKHIFFTKIITLVEEKFHSPKYKIPFSIQNLAVQPVNILVIFYFEFFSRLVTFLKG